MNDQEILDKKWDKKYPIGSDTLFIKDSDDKDNAAILKNWKNR